MLNHFNVCTQVRLRPRKFIQNSGQGLLEYGLIIFLIVIGIITAASLLGDEIRTLYENILLELASWLT